MISIESGPFEAIDAGPLRLRFDWMGDHWKHRLSSLTGDGPVPLVWSVEGSGSEPDPARVPSPTYQQLQIHREGDSGKALLVGQSGPHHFSASFVVTETEDGVVVEVDIADRCRSPIEALASTYLIEPSLGHLDAGEIVSIAWDHPATLLVFEAEAPARVCADEKGMGHIRVQALAGLDPANQTHRLRYRWRCVSHQGHKIWDRKA